MADKKKKLSGFQNRKRKAEEEKLELARKEKGAKHKFKEEQLRHALQELKELKERHHLEKMNVLKAIGKALLGHKIFDDYV
nr:unnamed protein product [Callosobruchus chinensis]